jgi:class 3 adenylate cyclase
MSVNPVKRKLAAILAADAVGYSRMMAADEEGTMKVLSAHRSMIDGIIEFHEGRIINTAGDSVLAEFASPTQAVRCAVEIQDALKTRNDTLPEDRRMHFRIGVNLGDVMVKGDDLLGDGVNVAARLEGIAEPGKIYIASSVYDQIAGKLDLGFVDLGEQTLKNIDRPIRAYRVDRDSRGVTVAKRKSGAKPISWIAAALAAVALGAGVLWFQGQQAASRQEESAKAKAAADAEIAKARAEAEEARKTAAAAAGTAAAAQRALEEQRIAATRARAQAELSAARSDAEATRRKADAELSAASETRRVAEAAAKTAAEAAAKAQAAAAIAAKPAATQKWAASLVCGSAGSTPPAAYTASVVSVGNAFALRQGTAGQPGALQMNGTRQPDGRLLLSGNGISSLREWHGQSYQASVAGSFKAERYVGRGKLGDRDCALTLLTEAAAASRAAAEAAAQTGPWAGTMTCASGVSAPPEALPVAVVVTGQAFDMRRGKPDAVPFLQMNGLRQADGKMRVAGKGTSGAKENLGQAYKAEFDGRFTGERYEGRGKIGSRDCALIITRK